MGERVPETERTYVADERARRPDLDGLPKVASVDGPDPVELDAVYFDTADLRLAARRITLRRRTGGDDAGWHLKLPTGQADTRQEVRVPLTSGTARTVPVSLAAEVAVHTRGRPLVRVARIVNHRERTRLLGADGTPLAEIAHDHVVAETADTEPLRWTETEVELLAGGRRLLDAVEARLTAAGLRRSDFPSKLGRALGDRVPPPPAPRPATLDTAGDAVLHYLHRRVADLTDHDPRVRRGEPDAVHRMRVATRRLRSALRTHRRVLDRRVTDPVADELKWLAGVLGAERDREVLEARLADRLAELPAALVTARVADRVSGSGPLGRAHRGLLRSLRGRRYHALLDRLDALLADPPLLPAASGPAGPAMRDAVRREHRRLARRVRRALRTPEGTERDVALHETRKAAKRTRYAAESARRVLGRPARRYRRRLTEVQRLLGEHQDSVLCREEIARLAADAHAAGEDTFAYGVMYQAERGRAAADEAALPAVWRDAERGRLAG